MNKTFEIERNGEKRSVIIRQMAHDEQYAVGSKIKWGSGKVWTVTGEQSPVLG